jgi:lysozyme family protein
MPLPLFEDIVKKLYWDSLYLDTLKSQAIAEFLFDMVWGSGLGGIKGQVRDLQNFLISKKIDVVDGADGGFGKNTITALNNFVKTKAREKEVFDVLYNSRSKFLKGLEDTGSYGRGWLRRLDELTARAYSLIGETAKKPIVKIGAILLIGVSGFFLYKGLKKA